MLDFSQTLRSDRPLIHPTCTVKNCTFGAYVELGDHCIAEETVFGDYTYLFGSNDVIFAALGKFNSIATGVRVNPVNHPMRDRVAAHHLTYRAAHYGLGEDDPSVIAWRRERRVVTGNDVWIGHNAVIMGGVTLGDGAVVGAGAVVTHDAAPYEIIGGVPARHLGWRYDEDTIAALLRVRWWDWSREELRERLDDLKDVPSFIRKYDKK